MKSFRDIEPFRQGQPAKSSDLEAMRREINKFSPTPGSITSPGSHSHTPRDYPLREKFVFANTSGFDIPQYSIFTVKRSAVTNTPFGPPVNVEGFFFEFGHVHATNQECAAPAQSPFGYWAETISSLPVLINYDPQFTPAIGHQMGPNHVGQLALNKAGFVVIGEPDTINKRVWVCKSNDQQIRVRIGDLEIKPNRRGAVIVVGNNEVEPEYQQGGDIEANCNYHYPGDPDKVNVTTPYILTYVMNLTERALYIGETVYAVPVLGLGLVITTPPHSEIVRVRAEECIEPNSKDKKGRIWRLLDCGWAQTDEQVLLTDINNSNMVVTDLEFVFAISRPICCSDFAMDGPNGELVGRRRFDILGSSGLHRIARASEKIECGASGRVEILLKLEEQSGEEDECANTSSKYRCSAGGTWFRIENCQSPCVDGAGIEGTPCTPGTPDLEFPCKSDSEQEPQEPPNCEASVLTDCYVTACNSVRCIAENEEVEIDYIGGLWVLTPRPKNTRWLATLKEKLCPEGAQAQLEDLKPLDVCTQEEITYADNKFHLAGLAGDEVLIERNIADCESQPFVSQVTHKCYDIVVDKTCGGLVSSQQTKALKKNGCALEIFVLERVSIATCSDVPLYQPQLVFQEIKVPYDVNLTMETEDLANNECNNVCQFTCVNDPETDEFIFVQTQGDPGYTCEENCDCDPPDPALCNQGTEGQVTTTPCVDIEEDIACKLRLRKRYVNLCVLSFEDQPDENDYVQFTLQEIDVNPLLELDGGGGTGSGDPLCEDPFLLVKTQKIKVMVCAIQNPAWDVYSTLPLVIQDAYVEQSTTTADGQTCKNLIPEQFIVFQRCDTLDPEPFICGRPCPIEEGGSGSGE